MTLIDAKFNNSICFCVLAKKWSKFICTDVEAGQGLEWEIGDNGEGKVTLVMKLVFEH